MASLPSVGESPEWRSLSSSVCLTLGPTGAVSFAIDGTGTALAAATLVTLLATLLSVRRFTHHPTAEDPDA